MTLFCPVSGLPVKTNRKWLGKKTGRRLTANYHVLGDAVIYSMPEGHADFNAARASLSLNRKVAETVAQGSGPYIQIQDYAFLESATLSARRLFIKKMDNDKRLKAVIFCNLSHQLGLAVRIGRQFKTSSAEIHIVKNYADAVRLSMRLCRQANLNIPPVSPVIRDNRFPCPAYLRPIDLAVDKDWQIDAPGFSNRSAIIDRHILYSQSIGFLEPNHIPLIDSMRENCQDFISKESAAAAIDYIVVDCKRMDGGNRRARFEYMQSLKKWHQRFPIKMYIAFNANRFMKTALVLAGVLMPFKVRIVKDLDAAVSFIRDQSTAYAVPRENPKGNNTSVTVSRNDLNNLLAYIGRLNWEDEKQEQKIGLDEDHPLFYLYQSIALMKEEMDDLFKERRQKEIALLEGENRYQSLFKNNHSTMLILNPKTGRIVDANPAALRFYGWSYDAIIRKHIFEINMLTWEETQKEMKLAQSEERRHFFFKHHLKNGDIRDVEVYSGPIMIKGEPLLYSIIHDITERKSAQKKLKESREKFRLFVDASPDLYFLKDIDGRYQMVNTRVAEFFKKKEPEIIGKTDFDLMWEENARHFQKSDKKAVAEKKMVISTEVVGGNVLELRKIPVINEGLVTGVAGIIRDITEKANAELEREKLISKLHTALDEIKTLKGIVPICSNCKKIRDDKGYWNLLESYIERHSDASFTHSMCPECLDKFYGNEDWYSDLKKE